MSDNIKDNVDFSTFTDRRSSRDLFSNSIRRAFKFDSYGGRTKFQAIVITEPIPLSPSDLKHFVNGHPPKKPTKEPNNVTQFTYRGRIIGENSPHSFLPDPCDTTYATDPESALKVTGMHTLFVSNEEFGAANSLPRLGSIVEVQLKKNVFGYNLQYGKHIKLVTNPPPSNDAEDCDTLVSAMATANGFGDSISLAATMGSGRGSSYENNFDPDLGPISPPVDMSKCNGTNFGIGYIGKKQRWHPAIDYGCGEGTTRGKPIYAVADGVLNYVGGGKCREGHIKYKETQEHKDLKCATRWDKLTAAEKADLKNKYPTKIVGNKRLSEISRATNTDCHYYSYACGGYGGNGISINHVSSTGGRFRAYYGHMDFIDYSLIPKDPATGKRLIKEGQMIGSIGNTGNTTGPHLHFQMNSLTNSKYVGSSKKIGSGINPIYHYHDNHEHSKRVLETGESMPEDLPEEEVLSPEDDATKTKTSAESETTEEATTSAESETTEEATT